MAEQSNHAGENFIVFKDNPKLDFKGIFSNRSVVIATICAACVLVGLGGVALSKQNQSPKGVGELKGGSGLAFKESLKPGMKNLDKLKMGAVAKPEFNLNPGPPMPADYKPSAELVMGAAPDLNLVAMTFDAGGDAKAVPAILKALKDRNLRVTFFLTGRFCEHFPTECKSIADAGMEIGNHSFNHPHFTKLSEKQIIEQLEKSEAIITKTCGRGAKPLFRFPYGDCDARTQRIVSAQGYQPIRWTLDSLDSVGHKKSGDFVEARINKKIKPGYITLMHVSETGSADALPAIFDHIEKMGAKIVPVSEMLKSKPVTESLPE